MKKWFTLIETLVTVLILSMLSMLVFDFITESKQINRDAFKRIQSIQLANSLVNKVVNIRDSSWIKSRNRDIANDDSVICSSKLDADFEWLVLWTNFWWFCNYVVDNENKSIADLDWNYAILEEIDTVTNEIVFKLKKVDDSSYSWYKFIDSVSSIKLTSWKTIEEFFDGRTEDLSILDKYDKYRDEKMKIPDQKLLYTIKFVEAEESDLSNVVDTTLFWPQEKQYMLDQTKKVFITVEYTDESWNRKKTSVIKILTNYK